MKWRDERRGVMLSLFRSWSPNSGLACAPTDDYQWLLPPPGVKQLVQVRTCGSPDLNLTPRVAAFFYVFAERSSAKNVKKQQEVSDLNQD